MKLSRGDRRDNLLNRFFSVSQRLNFICMQLFNVCANKLNSTHLCPYCSLIKAEVCLFSHVFAVWLPNHTQTPNKNLPENVQTLYLCFYDRRPWFQAAAELTQRRQDKEITGDYGRHGVSCAKTSVEPRIYLLFRRCGEQEKRAWSWSA